MTNSFLLKLDQSVPSLIISLGMQSPAIRTFPSPVELGLAPAVSRVGSILIIFFAFPPPFLSVFTKTNKATLFYANEVRA